MALNIDREIKTFIIPPGVTEEQIRKAGRNPGIRSHLNKVHGKDEWKLQELVDYLVDPSAKANRLQLSKERREAGNRKKAKERVEAYAATFENVTENDKSTLDTLVTIEIRMEDIRELLQQETLPGGIKQLSESLTMLSREHRQLQETLGIGRAKRGDEYDARAELKQFKDQALDFLKNKTIPVRCSRCPESTVINLGYLLFHFKEDVPWNLTFVCPRCGELNNLMGQMAFEKKAF